MNRRAFTFTELILAVGLLAVLLLTLVALTLSTLRSNQKAALLGPASRAAKTLLNETLYQVELDRPAGTRDSFWSTNGLWRDSAVEGAFSSGGIDYQYAIYANTVFDSSGAPLGKDPGNRVKKVDLVLWWYSTRPQQGYREGMGRLELQASRLVNEIPPPTP
ncbi:hypothetical protein DYH09_10800 [bacterium CPR1]|nr:hypothetical protein [bacterium CPR1]